MTSALIYQQIAKVMADVGPVSKGRENKQQNYKFRGIDEIYNALQPQMAKHGVFSVPEVLEEKREERQSKSGGVLVYTVLKVKYTFYATDGSSVAAIVLGEAMDSGDKASNKAMSAAQKYAFLQIFAIPTEDEKDSEHQSPEPKPRGPKIINEAQRTRLYTIATTASMPDDQVKAIMGKYGFTSSKQITVDKYDAICSEVEAHKPVVA